MPNTIIKMPQLGESVAEGTIGRWLKQPGDRVERDEPLVEIQTDKVNAEVPSPVAGILQQILLPEGTTAAVKTDMAIIGDEAPTASGSPAAQPPIVSASAPSRPAQPAPAFTYDTSAGGGVVGHRDEEPHAPETNGAPPKRFYTPVVLRMAEEHGIDLATIEGSGAHGRVTRKDVERAIASGAQGTAGQSTAPAPPPPSAAAVPPATAPPATAPAATAPAATVPPAAAAAPSFAPPTAAPAPPAPATSAPATPVASAPGAPLPQPASLGGSDQVALTPMRRAIADHMARARADIPDAWSIAEIDVTRLVRYRDRLQPDWQRKEGYELTYLPFFVKAVLAGLRAV
ncbi:MAG: E3 binding domain-containing protein, partial [Chloroflexi bacterium]|nr:E3 binding domain-containing protein [Chloroflexota bacterium]